MKHFYPSRRSLNALRAIIIFISILIVILLRFSIPIEKVGFIAAIVICLLDFVLMFVYLPLYISSMKYIATNSEIIKSSGVLVKFHQSIKYSSIQYSMVIKTPFSNITELNFLVFFVFGGQMRVAFLNNRDINEIRILSGSITEDDI